MKTNTIRTAMISLITIGLMATATTAFAGKGMGYRNNADCPYGRQTANLTDEQVKQLDAERQSFFDATKTQRQDLRAKRLELRAEIAKRSPNMKKASSLQKEVSDLQAQLDQKRLTHIMKMREINPDAGMGFFGDSDARRGHGHGPGHGRGCGPGNCR